MMTNFSFSRLLRVPANAILPIRQSALFINGHKATETFVFITPDVNYPKESKEQIDLELTRRKSSYNFSKLENLWEIYKELKERKTIYETKKLEISNEITKHIKESSDDNVITKLKIQNNMLKENIKILKSPLWSAELEAMTHLLKLPNKLHPMTGDTDNIIHTHLAQPLIKRNHLEVGHHLDIIHFKKNESYYLSGDAAVFELGVKFYFSRKLKQYKYTQFSNTDFVKSVVIEGCGGDHTDPDSTFILHHNENTDLNLDNRLHLTGAASLCSFFAFHAKNVIYSKLLPLKYFTFGRQYTPSPSDEDSLFHVSQSSVVQTFEVSRDENEQKITFNSVIDILKEVYSDIGFHYRLNILPAHKLMSWESLRVSIEMYSTFLNEYVEVGNVSLSDDFLSKRLLFTFTDKKESRYPYIMSGTIVNIPKLLGCILEQDKDFKLPEIFDVDNWEGI